MHIPCVEVDADSKELKGFIHLHRKLDLVHIWNERCDLVCAPAGGILVSKYEAVYKAGSSLKSAYRKTTQS